MYGTAAGQKRSDRRCQKKQFAQLEYYRARIEGGQGGNCWSGGCRGLVSGSGRCRHGTGGPPASAGLPGGSNTIVVGVWMMQPGEDLVVAKRLREVLQGAVGS